MSSLKLPNSGLLGPSPDEMPTARLGLRERNKIRKELLIRQAAHELFVEKGFERTTLRDVAERADVGFGTVFSYAVDKAGLLAMVFVEALKSRPPLFTEVQTGNLLDDLVVALTSLYEFWAKTPNLSRVMIQQMEFYVGNPHMDIILARRVQTRGELADWLRSLQLQHIVRANIDIDDAAATVFAIYTSALREWVAADVWDVSEGVGRLRTLLALPTSAMVPATRKGSATGTEASGERATAV
jgi:AcrR family transcriptional regulator